MRKINKGFTLFVGLFIIVTAILVFLFQKFTPLVNHITYYCESYINNQATPIPYYLSIIPFGILFIILSISMVKFFLLNIKVFFLKRTLRNKAINIPYVQKLLIELGLQDKTIVIQSEKNIAYCVGIRKPKIYISTGLLSTLTPQETEVVLRHEEYHLRSHDTFILIVASVTQSLFPFFPLVGDLINKYRVEREIQADKFAISKVGQSKTLVATLKKLLYMPTNGSLSYAAIADHGTLEPRIYSLLNKQYKTPQIQYKHAFITILSSFVLGVIAFSPISITEMHHDHYDFMSVCIDNTK